MVFSSLVFLYFFLPVVFIFYFLINHTDYRNVILILASLTFYAWGEPVWVVILILNALTGHYFSKRIEKYRADRRGKTALAAVIGINLSILIFFKYINFIAENINFLFSIQLPYSEIGLPIGISFYTFQVISYAVDVYRKETRTPDSLIAFLLYVSLFPQLIAGPIIRFKDIKDQLENRRFSFPMFSKGVQRFVIGLGKKVILANTAGETAEIFLNAGAAELAVLGAWFGIMLFALQIYFDFSGYSDMAIGLGMMFGLTYKENFNYPYISRSAGEFWRRWNISLGHFFRDYVYIPLGGNRRFYVRNLMCVWFLTGLWHGASWNFIVWGLYFGALIYLERMVLFRWFIDRVKWLSHVYFIFVILIGWVFFYFTDLQQGISYLRAMFGLLGNPLTNIEFEIYFFDQILFFIVAVIAATPFASNLVKRMHDKWFAKQPFMDRIFKDGIQPIGNLLLLLLCTIFLVGQTYNPFFYFRF